MKVFHIGDKVRIDSELARYSANKHWIGKTGEVLRVLGENVYLVKWEHLENPMERYADLIERI